MTHRPSRPAPAPFAKLAGVWRSHGYGTLIEIGAAGYRLFEETAVSCLPVFAGTLEELAVYYVDVRVSPGRQAFSARRATGVTRVKYRRLKALPRRCAAAGERDPVRDFDVFWHTFSERYALFDLKGIDWSAVYDEHRPLVHAGTGQRRLYEIFVGMLAPLNDGHVELHAPCGLYNAGTPPPVLRRIARAHGLAPADPEALNLLVGLGERSREIVLGRYLRSPPRRSRHGLIEWGRLDEATGYLSIRAMAGQSGRTNDPREDQRLVASTMSRVLGDLGDLPALVLDVRRNSGGYDGVALRIAGHFTDRKRLAFTKAASKGDEFGGRQKILVEPRGSRRYRGRIFLLTSDLTTSAAEIFVLALLGNPRVTRVGERTHGELSDVMERHLPNGWTVMFSNELYRASDGEIYEDRGVPPHVRIPFLDPDDVAAGRDPMLDLVLAGVGESGPRTGARMHGPPRRPRSPSR